jgi:hypothetical protein
MHMFGKPLEDVPIEELAKAFENTQVGSQAFEAAVAEINRRQAVAQIKAAGATVQAAVAQKLAAEAQILKARWTIGAVVVAAIAVAVSALGIWLGK